jgi:hypothetical protein
MNQLGVMSQHLSDGVFNLRFVDFELHRYEAL